MRLQGTEFKIMHSQQFWLWPWQGAAWRVLLTLLFWWNTDFDADSELEGAILITFGNFRRYPAGLCFRHLKNSLNGLCLCVFHAIVSRNRAGLSARFLEYVPLRMYFSILSNRLSFMRRFFTVAFFLRASTSAALIVTATVNWVRLLRLTLFSTHVWLWFHYISS